MTDYEKFALAVACPYCTARPAQRCRTASGARAPMHAARTEPFRLAWLAGYEEAEAEKPVRPCPETGTTGVTPSRWLCACGWRGPHAALLTAPHPFDVGAEDISGCPDCLAVCGLRPACDEPDCWRSVTCATPTPTGYRSTCSSHAPDPVRS
jgi:hypothetical protein